MNTKGIQCKQRI